MKKINLVLLSSFLIPSLVSAYSFEWYPMMWWAWWFWYGWIIMLILWFVIIIWIISAIRYIPSNKTDSKYPSKDAIDILKERYAKWEIDKKQFEEMKKDLDK